MDNKEKAKEIYKQTDRVNFKYSVGDIHIFGNLFHCNYEIFFLIEGNVQFRNAKVLKQLVPYELIIIPPGTYHQFIVTSEVETYRRCVLEFGGGLFNGVDAESCLWGKDDLLLTKDSRITQAFFRLIEYSSYRYNEYFAQILYSILAEILVNIKIEDNCTVSDSLHSLSTVTRGVLNYIDLHISEEISLKLLSKKLFLSVSTICHIFQKELGISVMQYIKQKRMILAKQLLDNGQKPTDVYSKIGYADYSSFFRSFRDYYGKAPTRLSRK